MNRDESKKSDSGFRKYRENFVALGVGAACVLLAVIVAYVAATTGNARPGDAPPADSGTETESESGTETETETDTEDEDEDQSEDKDEDQSEDKDEDKDEDESENAGENEQSSGAAQQLSVIPAGSDGDSGCVHIGGSRSRTSSPCPTAIPAPAMSSRTSSEPSSRVTRHGREPD